MKYRFGILLLALIVVTLFTGCQWVEEESPPVVSITPTKILEPDQRDEEEQVWAPVEEIDVAIMESFPPQAMVRVVGNLPTPCHNLGEPVITIEASRFSVALPMLLPDGDAMCVQVLEPFETSVNLGTITESGQYTVVVNGVEVTFEI